MLRRTLLLSTVALLPCAALAQAPFPSKTITLVVPAAPGGTTDLTARLLGDPLSKLLGQPVIVDNKPGGNGNIGTVAVARAPADGHTLLVQYSGYHVGNPWLQANLPWKGSDFAPVALAIRAPQVVVVPVTLPVKTLKEFVEYAKKNPGKVNYASSGNGSIQHIAGEMLNQARGHRHDARAIQGLGPGLCRPDLQPGADAHHFGALGDAAHPGREVARTRRDR